MADALCLRVIFVYRMSNDILNRPTVSTGAQDYKRFSSMSRCSTHNLCSEMT